MTSDPSQSTLENESPAPAANLPPLSYRERPLTRHERKLLTRLWQQHEEGVLWSRYFVRLLPLIGFGTLYSVAVGALVGWQSPMLYAVIGILGGSILMNFIYQRVIRRNWAMFKRIINWQDVEQMRIRDEQSRQKGMR